MSLGLCGGCWAFSTTGVIADRLCIKGYTNAQMSAEHSIQCDNTNNGCDGGMISRAFQFDKDYGVVPLACKSYRDDSIRRCSDTCDNQEKLTESMKYYIQTYQSISRGKTDDEIITEIKKVLQEDGSVSASFKVTYLIHYIYFHLLF